MKYAENLLHNNLLLNIFLSSTQYVEKNGLDNFVVNGDYIYFKREDESDSQFDRRIKDGKMYREDLYLDNFSVYNANGKANDYMSLMLRKFNVAYFGENYLNDVLHYLPCNYYTEAINLEQTFIDTCKIKPQFKMPNSYDIFSTGLCDDLVAHALQKQPDLLNRFARILEPGAKSYVFRKQINKDNKEEFVMSTITERGGELNKYVFDTYQIRSNYSSVDTAKWSGVWRYYLAFNLPKSFCEDYKISTLGYNQNAMFFLSENKKRCVEKIVDAKNYAEQKQAYLNLLSISNEMQAIKNCEDILFPYAFPKEQK